MADNVWLSVEKTFGPGDITLQIEQFMGSVAGVFLGLRSICVLFASSIQRCIRVCLEYFSLSF